MNFTFLCFAFCWHASYFIASLLQIHSLLLSVKMYMGAFLYASFAAYMMSCFVSRGHWRNTVGGSWSFPILGSWLSSFTALPRVVSSVLVACRVQLSLSCVPPTPFVAFDLVCGGTVWRPSRGLCPSSDHYSPYLLNLVHAPRECLVGLIIW